MHFYCVKIIIYFPHRSFCPRPTEAEWLPVFSCRCQKVCKHVNGYICCQLFVCVDVKQLSGNMLCRSRWRRADVWHPADPTTACVCVPVRVHRNVFLCLCVSETSSVCSCPLTDLIEMCVCVQQMAVCPLPDGPRENNNTVVPARPKLICWILARYAQVWSAASSTSRQAGRPRTHCMHDPQVIWRIWLEGGIQCESRDVREMSRSHHAWEKKFKIFYCLTQRTTKVKSTEGAQEEFTASLLLHTLCFSNWFDIWRQQKALTSSQNANILHQDHIVKRFWHCVISLSRSEDFGLFGVNMKEGLEL